MRACMYIYLGMQKNSTYLSFYIDTSKHVRALQWNVHLVSTVYISWDVRYFNLCDYGSSVQVTNGIINQLGF
jgi:hypothetical protein